MRYFVIVDSGIKYGPFEVRELNRLAFENRISRTSRLFEEDTDKEANITEVVTFAPPVGNRLEAYSYHVKKESNFDLYNIISICCIFIFPPAGIVFSFMALKLGKVLNLPRTTATVTLVINIIISALWFAALAAMIYFTLKVPYDMHPGTYTSPPSGMPAPAPMPVP